MRVAINARSLIVVTALVTAPLPGATQGLRTASNAANAQSLLSRPARLEVQQVPLLTALAQLSERSGVALAYSPSLLPAELRVSCFCTSSNLSEALDRLLARTPFTYREADGQVVLIPRSPVRLDSKSTSRLAAADSAGTTASAGTSATVGAPPTAAAVAPAEPATITGRVTSTAGGPVGGATVALRDLRLSTVTNEAGVYRLVVPPERVVERPETLYVNRVGYRARAVPFDLKGGMNHVDVVLGEQAVALDAVVVTGTAGNQERRAQSAVVGSIDATDVVANSPVSNVTQVLEGRIPGVLVTESSGTTGASSRINIRGSASLSLSNEPLVFIDGVRMESGQRGLVDVGGQSLSALNDIDPEDIERIEVVKGPAAATLYGADASAGVIQIITKKGRAGGRGLTQSLSLEYDRITPNFTPYTNYATCSADLVGATSPNPLCRGQAVDAVVADNPLRRQSAFRDGTMSGVQYNAQGGGDVFGFYGSAGYDKEVGTTLNTVLDRRSGRGNVNWIASPQLTLNASFGLSRIDNTLPPGDQAAYGYLIGAGLGSPLTVGTGPDGSLSGGWLNGTQSVASISAITSEIVTTRTTPSVQVQYNPRTWFTNRITAGADIGQSSSRQFYPKNTLNWYSGDQADGWVQDIRDNISLYTVDYLGNVRSSFGKQGRVTSDLSFGSQWINRIDDALLGTGIGLTTNAANLVSGAATNSASQSYNQQKSLGFLAQEQLGFRDKLFLQVGARVDRNSSFGQDAGSFFLPKAGFSYVMSEEPFWQRSGLSVVNTFRLRGAYGTTGRAPTPGAALQTYYSAPYVTSAGTLQPGLVPLNPGNPNLKPERGREFEAGFDAGFFGDRAGIELTYFDKLSTDLLVQVPQPPSSGFTVRGSSYPYENIGRVSNRGIEFGLRATPVSRKNVAWDASINGSTLHNELQSLGSVVPFTTSYRRFTPGRQLGAWYVNRITSVDVASGQVLVSDTAEFLGNQIPTFQGSFNSTLTLFDKLRLYALFTAKTGYRVYNLGQEYRDRFFGNSAEAVLPTSQGGYSDAERLRRFGPYVGENSGAQVPFTEVKEDYIQSGDYLRFQELSATFSLPDRYLQSLGASAASLTFGARNIALWTKFKGYDPEVLGTGPGSANNAFYNQFFNAEVFTTPPSRRFVARVNVQF